ncbi:nucleotidyltransferase family protein, partial [Clavibacter michiganensis]
MAASRDADDDGRSARRIAGVVLAAGAGTRFG